MPESHVTLVLQGREAAPTLPPVLKPSTRSAGQAADVFLPPDYLRPTCTFDMGASARGSAEGLSEQTRNTDTNEIVVLELTDGSTFISNAGRLRDTLARTAPELLGRDGEILLEKLREGTAAPRGFLGDAVGGLISKVFILAVKTGLDDILGDAVRALTRDRVADAAQLGVTWLGTKALMAAVESRLHAKPGALYHWNGAAGGRGDLTPATFPAPDPDGPSKPLLIFVHGVGSCTQGSFGDLQSTDRDLWATLEKRYGDRIYAFEHRTLSESPIANARALVEALPEGAHIRLVSHSRGGLVADLLCLDDFSALIDGYAHVLEGTGDADPQEAERVIGELRAAHAHQRLELQALNTLLRERRIVVERYVRVASPAHGTRLASANFDLFLSGLLTLLGKVPFFFGSPFYEAFKRIVIDIAKNRTNAHLVPGIEAMLPDSPMARLLSDAPVKPGIQMAVIAGDIEGGNLLTRLGVLLTDFIFFDNTDNDLVVDTAAMLSGVAPKAQARVLLDRGPDVSHFRYFANLDTRTALRDWLVADTPASIDAFSALPDPAADAVPLVRDADGVDRPVVVVLPGVMGSHLKRGKNDRVWFDPVDIAAGGLSKIAFDQPGIEAEELFAMFYGKLCKSLAGSHRVECFAYDWRQPLDVLAERFGALLDRLLRETKQPIRLLAHSMGGLVVRATIHKRRAVMDELMGRDGARLVMLGTPHQGAHSMVENLIGKGSTLRSLVRLDVKHDMQQVLDIVAGFRGALQLLPKPGFKDIFQGDPDGGQFHDFQSAQTWQAFRPLVKDLWFGNGRVGQPPQDVLDQASWLWSQDKEDRPALPDTYAAKSVYVYGVARNTPCGVREEGDRLQMVGTTRGDGTVTWESGRIGGIGSFYYMPAEHGDLTAVPEHFPALTDLLVAGVTGRLATSPPAVRAIEQPVPSRYDAGPPTVDDADALQRGLMGGSQRSRTSSRPKRRLQVTVKAADLRFVRQPLMVGHYEQDPIAGPQALIDQEVLQGDLTERFNLGLYTGPLGTATSVLRVPNEFERRRGSLTGAIVTGLGRYDGALSQQALTEAVRTGVLRYLLQTADVLGKQDRDLPLATLLLGYNSSANMTIAASVEALVRGTLEANAKFHETTRLNIRVTRLDIVEIYLDTAITAVYALRQLSSRLMPAAEHLGTALVLNTELAKGEGFRQRLFEVQGYSYWPRLIITDAAGSDEPPCATAVTSAPAPGTALAQRMRFVYVGQRARAESVLLQRQPELIEKLVRQQIASPHWQEDFGRMLFQLMLPHDFKEAARQLDRVVLVVDAGTANMPWELMLADDPLRKDDDRQPLALRTAVVRQFATSGFRRHVREGIARSVLVIGAPSVEGFVQAFPGTPERPMSAPPDLPGAEAESTAAAATFKRLGYDVTAVIGAHAPAKDVLAALYRGAYRFIHISAHGVFQLLHADGKRRSGVVLSDGLLITAAEIAAMEAVPEVVFMNCCHLGKIEFASDGNKLAASVARELIDIGVRCVVVAGWAVTDDLAQLFGQTFYEGLLLQHLNFGQAVFEARKAVWRERSADITWGAFQAYGEPGWVAEPRAQGASGPGNDGRFASPEELLDQLARVRVNLRRRHTQHGEAELRALRRTVEEMLDARCPAGWLETAQLQSALGATWHDLHWFEEARAAYLRAVQAEDLLGQVPIRDLERLANIEARLGGERKTLDGDPLPPGVAESGEALIRSALARLDGLDRLTARPSGQGGASTLNAERSALRAGAHLRLARLCAEHLLRPTPTGAAASAPSRSNALNTKLLVALAGSADAHRAVEIHPTSGELHPYPALDRLAITALMPPEPGGTRAEAKARRAEDIALAQRCAQALLMTDASDPDPWNLIMLPESLLVERMLDGTLAQPGRAGQAELEALQRTYSECLSGTVLTPAQLDSVTNHLDTLSLLAAALALTERDSARRAMLEQLAERLETLASHLQPNHPGRKARPARSPSSAASGGTAATKTRQAAGRKPAAAEAPPSKAAAKTRKTAKRASTAPAPTQPAARKRK